MINESSLCFGCMSSITNKSVCPNCGYIQGTENLSEYIQPEYILNDRYLIGKVISFNGQSVNYIAYDKHNDRKVVIEEFFPENVVNRDKDNFDVIPQNDKHNIFNDLKNDFIGLIKSVVKMRSENIVIYYDFFELNSTVYLVKEYVCGIKLNKFLAENAGAVNWNEVQDYFKSLINALIILNNSGIIHKGISPENIILVQDGDKIDFKLINFSINDLRLKNSRINPQLYIGYTSPEQYSSNNVIYDNTDVYSICAVLYKCLTGTTPVDAFSRSLNDNMVAPNLLNSEIPKNISTSIMEGLAISPDNRIKDMQAFYNKIYQNQQDFTRVYNKDTVVIQPSKLDEEHVEDNIENEKDVKRKSVMFKALIITLPILIVVLVLLWIFVFMGNGNSSKNNSSNLSNSSSKSNLSSSNSSVSASSNQSSSSSESSSSEDDKEYQMPNLIGKNIDIVLNSSGYKEFLVIETEEVYSDQYEKSIIIEQSLKEGEAIAKNTKIIVKVSKGTRYPRIPDYTGLNISEYKKMLDDLQIKYKIKYVENSSYKNGMVFNIDRTVGSSIDISDQSVLNIEVIKNK